LREGKTIKSGLEQYLDQRGKVITKVLDQAEGCDGYSSIFSTRPMAEAELVRLRFDKDIVEEAFRSLTVVVRLQPVRHRLAQRIVAHVFICYLACLLLSLLKFRLKTMGISPDEAPDELKTTHKVYLRDAEHVFKIARVAAPAKCQTTILEAINPKLWTSESWVQ
jgi:transposase